MSIHFKEDEIPSITYDSDNQYVLKRKIGSYERKTSKAHDSLFSRLRSSIRQMGNPAMFLYGTPSPAVLMLLARLYNHNVIRARLQTGQLSSQDAVPVDYSTILNYSMMTGVAEVNGTLYITISEDPREDKGYVDKIKILVTLLHYANYKVEYDSEELSVLAEDVYRQFGVKREQLFPDYIPMPYGIPITKTQFDSFGINEFTVGNTDNLFNSLQRGKLRVVLIHSFDYLLTRRAGDRGQSHQKSPNAGVTFMYPPFKRLWSSKGTGIYSCNNGSTCAESKMFSYLHAKSMFNSIQGYAAYWLGKSMPPNHIISGYNYLVESNKGFDSSERTHLNELKNAAKSVMDPSLFEILHNNSSKDVFDYFVQPFALPCPGCFSNYTNYTTNTFEEIDNSNCFHVKQIGQTIRRRRGKHGMQQSVEPLTTDEFKGNGASAVSSKTRKQGGRHKSYRSRCGRRSRRSRRNRNTRRRRL
jgi:hypothetical protein